MLLIKYIILGIIQGFTEPLPISSSGHIKIFKEILSDQVLNDINFEIVVNFGSLLAIIYLYRYEIINIIKEFFLYIKTKNKKYKLNYKYTWLIVLGTIPASLFGLFIKDIIDDIFNTKLVGLMFIITAILLYMIKDIKGKKEKKDITYLDALKIGLFQVIALLPGISRSGATVVGAMKSNLKRESALEFSFMLYIPISIASFILGMFDLIKTPNINTLIIPYIVSMIVSSIVTYYSAKLFINIMKKGKLIYFSIYCSILGLITFIIF
ncbi:MAG: undecaprenyl-diphosphate phosphatase [Bacilli bacterium]|nr:undecaprenyl-diphosphate phosphatase [Bacilli bacterium]